MDPSCWSRCQKITPVSEAITTSDLTTPRRNDQTHPWGPTDVTGTNISFGGDWHGGESLLPRCSFFIVCKLCPTENDPEDAWQCFVCEQERRNTCSSSSSSSSIHGIFAHHVHSFSIQIDGIPYTIQNSTLPGDRAKWCQYCSRHRERAEGEDQTSEDTHILRKCVAFYGLFMSIQDIYIYVYIYCVYIYIYIYLRCCQMMMPIDMTTNSLTNHITFWTKQH